jgi:hypothetical protein
MSGPSSEARQREADSVYRQVEALLEFMRPHRSPALVPGYRDAAERVRASGSPARIRAFRDGLLEPIEAGAVGRDEERRLDALLRERAGVSLDTLLARRLARIAKVRERGRIANRQQYDLVKERVESIWDDPARVEEFRALQALCSEYEEREARRATRAGGHRDPAA